MPVGVVMDFKDTSLDQYDQVIQKMGLRQGGAMPDGGLSHWVTKTDGGIRIIDVWESREQFEKFAEEQIGPFTQEVGIPGPPEIAFHNAHNYLLKS